MFLICILSGLLFTVNRLHIKIVWAIKIIRRAKVCNKISMVNDTIDGHRLVKPYSLSSMRNTRKSHDPLIETLEIASCINLKANNSGSYLTLSKITE